MKNFILIFIFFYIFYVFSLNSVNTFKNQNEIKINNFKNIFYKSFNYRKYNINKNILFRVNKIFLKGIHKFNPNIFLFQLDSKKNNILNFINIKNDINYLSSSRLFRRIIIMVSWTTENNINLKFLLKEHSIIKNKYISINDEIPLQSFNTFIPITIEKYTIINHSKIRKEINNLRKIYIYFGYVFININIFIEPFFENRNILKYTELNLLYLVDLKKKYLLGYINIKGNFFIRNRINKFYFNKILFYKYTQRFNLYKLKNCFLILNKLYQNNGYIKSKIYVKKICLLFNTNLIYVNFLIDKKKIYKINKINFIFAKHIIMSRMELKIFINLRVNSFFSQLELSKDIKNIILKYQNNGYINARITPLLRINNYNKNISILLNINSSNKIKIKKIIILGNKHVNINIVKNIIFSKIGYYYKKSILNFIKLKIDKTNYFKQINIIYTEIKNEKINIYIILNEKKINIIKGLYQYDKGFSLVNIKLNKYNFLKYNKKIIFSLILSKTQRKLDYNIINYYFRKYKIPFKISLNLYNNKYKDIKFYKIKAGSIFKLYIPIKYIYKKHMINSYFDKATFILGYKFNRYKINNNIFEIKSNIFSIYNSSLFFQMHLENKNIYSYDKYIMKLTLNIYSSILGSNYIKYLEYINLDKYFHYDKKNDVNLSWNINIKYYKLINKVNTLNKFILKLKTNIFILSKYDEFNENIKFFNNIELIYIYTKKISISSFFNLNNIYNMNYILGLNLKYATSAGYACFKLNMPLSTFIKNKNILFDFYFKS